MKRFILLLFVATFICISETANAQLTVTPGVSAQTLVQSLVGQGLTVSNVVINAPTNAYGTFYNGHTTNMAINNGILLTTGSATGPIGPNSSSVGACNGTSGSDPQLTSIEPLVTCDPIILEFDIVPQCNTLQIRFVFGSDEYPEFVSESFNDAFGFFISGPGPSQQPGFYNNTNAATLPNNSVFKSIVYDCFNTVITRKIDPNSKFANAIERDVLPDANGNYSINNLQENDCMLALYYHSETQTKPTFKHFITSNRKNAYIYLIPLSDWDLNSQFKSFDTAKTQRITDQQLRLIKPKYSTNQTTDDYVDVIEITYMVILVSEEGDYTVGKIQPHKNETASRSKINFDY